VAVTALHAGSLACATTDHTHAVGEATDVLSALTLGLRSSDGFSRGFPGSCASGPVHSGPRKKSTTPGLRERIERAGPHAAL